MEFWLAVILSQALYETLEGSERLLDDVKEVLNLNRVYAAGRIYNAMRVAQGQGVRGGKKILKLSSRGWG